MTQTIIDALSDPQLFGGAFDAPSWRPWLAFLRALFALPMDGTDLATYRHHTARQAPPSKPSRYAELVVGRRGGKSRVLALIAAYLASIPDHAPFIVPGENPVIAVIAADRKQAAIIKRYVVGLIQHSPLLATLIEDDLAETVRLSNGVFIEIHTGSIGAPRGRTFLSVLCDETAFWPMGDSANPDVEVINAVRPGLSTIPYSLLLVASSPYAKRGVLYSNYAKYFGRDDAPVLVWQGTTQEMNSSLEGDALIAEMYDEDPDRAAAEFGAQFRTDVVAFIVREAVQACLADGVREIPPGGGIIYVGHVDPSGGSADSMGLAIAHLRADGLAVLDAIREVKPPFSPDAVVEEFATLLKAYGISRVTGDAYAGEWPRERFAVHGIAYDVSRKNKSAIYGEFLPALNGGRVQLLDLPRLIGQLVGLERRTARGGRDSIDHAPGSHDDVANAACGALVQVISDRRPALIRKTDLAPDAAPAEHACAQKFFATAWVGIDGMAAWVLFSYSPHSTPRLIVVDFDYLPWSQTILVDVASRLDAACEALPTNGRQVLQHAPGAIMHVPQQLFRPAESAMRQVFLPRSNRGDFQFRDIRVRPLLTEQLADPSRLVLNAAVHVGSGDVRLSAAAMARNETIPLMGVLGLAPGEPVTNNALRVAFLFGAAQLDEARAAPEGAKLRMG